MSPELLTAILGPIVLILGTVVLPWFVRRQISAQAKADREVLAKQVKDELEVAARAARDANEGVTMKTINETIAAERDRLTVMLEREGVGHQKEIMALQSRFVQETDRLKRQTEEDLSKANTQIRHLIDEVRSLKHSLSGGMSVMEPPAGGTS
jgi:hypothetical protein